jgi:molybdate transport system substrate-binding protein
MTLHGSTTRRAVEESRMKRQPRSALLGGSLALAMLLVLGGAAVASEVLVATAASLREPALGFAGSFERLHPGATIRLSFGASSALAAQIRFGAPLDVFLSADSALVEELEAASLTDPASAFTLAGNRLVVVGRPGGGFTVTEPRDLLAPSIRRIALPAAAVPLGRYARTWLGAQGILDAVLARGISTEHARATLAAVEHGHADLAIVYATDARIAKRARIVYAIPDEEQPGIRYVATLTRRGRSSESARRFLESLRTPEAANLLRDAGFAAPIPEPAS